MDAGLSAAPSKGSPGLPGLGKEVPGRSWEGCRRLNFQRLPGEADTALRGESAGLSPRLAALGRAADAARSGMGPSRDSCVLIWLLSVLAASDMAGPMVLQLAAEDMEATDAAEATCFSSDATAIRDSSLTCSGGPAVSHRAQSSSCRGARRASESGGGGQPARWPARHRRRGKGGHLLWVSGADALRQRVLQAGLGHGGRRAGPRRRGGRFGAGAAQRGGARAGSAPEGGDARLCRGWAVLQDPGVLQQLGYRRALRGGLSSTARGVTPACHPGRAQGPVLRTLDRAWWMNSTASCVK